MTFIVAGCQLLLLLLLLLCGAVSTFGPCLLLTASMFEIVGLFSLILMCFDGILISCFLLAILCFVSGKFYDQNVATKVAVLFNMKYFDVFIILWCLK